MIDSCTFDLCLFCCVICHFFFVCPLCHVIWCVVSCDLAPCDLNWPAVDVFVCVLVFHLLATFVSKLILTPL